jgi:hypothetical protein
MIGTIGVTCEFRQQLKPVDSQRLNCDSPSILSQKDFQIVTKRQPAFVRTGSSTQVSGDHLIIVQQVVAPP